MGVLEGGQVRIDDAQKCIWQANRRVLLTPREYAILSGLAAGAGRVLSHEDLIRRAWPGKDDYNNRTSEDLRKYVYLIRRKLGQGVIQTRRGFGYILGDGAVATGGEMV